MCQLDRVLILLNKGGLYGQEYFIRFFVKFFYNLYKELIPQALDLPDASIDLSYAGA